MQIDTGNTGFMLLCCSLVMLMTPGLAFFYGGLVGRRNVLTIMFQSFLSLGWTTVLWFTFGYSMSFGPTVGGPVAMGYIEPASSVPGTSVRLIVRGQPMPATVVKLPFVANRFKR